MKEILQAESDNIKELSVLIPLYNSENTIMDLVDNVITTLHANFDALEIILVNDGSLDNSHFCALQVVKKHPGIVKYIRLARNFGEHNAIMCGLNYVTGDCVAIIDDDFQNPPSEILKLVSKLYEDYDVVYSYYTQKYHSWFRNLGSLFNNWVATKLLKKPKGLYLSSFKIIRSSLVRTIVQYRGPFPYIDGIILRSTTSIGQQLCMHEDRKIGRSNYTLSKLMHLWINMATGFSITPLRIASVIGVLMSIFATVLTIFFIVSRLTGGLFVKQHIPVGWASLIITITFFAGLQLCVLGLIGEYLGRLFLMMNRLPQYVVSSIYGLNESQGDENVKQSPSKSYQSL
jgi:Glycosyltransferases involved in cell wall biogenesis